MSMTTAIRLAVLLAFCITSTAMAQGPNVSSSAGGQGGWAATVLGTPCAGYSPARYQLFIEDFTQMFSVIRDLGAWVDGTHDAELENLGIVTTVRGAASNVLIASNEVGSDGLWLFQSGSVADTGLNMQSTLSNTCLTGTRCHPLNIPVAWLTGYGGTDFCAIMRFAVYVHDPVDTDLDHNADTGATWDSSVVIGFANLDTSIQAATTGALTRGVGANLWSGDGCLFHLNRAGVLAFRCGVGSSTSFLSTGANPTVDVSSLINHQKSHNYPTFFDVAIKLHQEPDGADFNNGYTQGWYRIVPHPGNNNHETVTPTEWTLLGTTANANDALPLSDTNAQWHFTAEFIQGSGNTDPDDGLEFFLSSVIVTQTLAESIQDDVSWPHSSLP